MKRFIKKTLPFILLGLLFVGIGEFFLLRFKEATPISKVADIQSKTTKELYYGRQFFENSLSLYKYEMLQRKQPKVLVIGQSVVLQFRDFMFEPYQNDFYNTGLMVRNLNDLEYLITLFENGKIKSPEFILMGLDLSFVLKNCFLDNYKSLKNPPKDQVLETQPHLKAIQNIYFAGKNRSMPDTDVGFGRSGMSGRGYRNDGSHRNKPEIENFVKDAVYVDYGNLKNKLDNRNIPFLAPIEYDSTKAVRLVTTLERFQKKGINLLLYFPAYSDEFFDHAKKDTAFYNFWQDYMALQSSLIQNGFDVIPFRTPKSIGLNDKYMIDAEHASEVLCGIQLYNHIKTNRESKPYLRKFTLKTLEQKLKSDKTVPISFLHDSISHHLHK